MSVAVRRSESSCAARRTLARMGMVLRRSTTLWTCASALIRTALSTVNFIPNGSPARARGGRRFPVSPWTRRSAILPARNQQSKGAPAAAVRRSGRCAAGSGLQHLSQQRNVLGKGGVLGHEFRDAGDRVHHRGVVAVAEAAADL